MPPRRRCGAPAIAGNCSRPRWINPLRDYNGVMAMIRRHGAGARRIRRYSRNPILGSLPVIGRLGRFQIPVPWRCLPPSISRHPPPPIPIPTVSRAVHGPELRAIFDLSDLDRSRFIIAPGQSGNLLSSHAGDLLNPWRSGQYVSLSARAGFQPAARSASPLPPNRPEPCRIL